MIISDLYRAIREGSLGFVRQHWNKIIGLLEQDSVFQEVRLALGWACVFRKQHTIEWVFNQMDLDQQQRFLSAHHGSLLHSILERFDIDFVEQFWNKMTRDQQQQALTRGKSHYSILFYACKFGSIEKLLWVLDKMTLEQIQELKIEERPVYMRTINNFPKAGKVLDLFTTTSLETILSATEAPEIDVPE